MKRCCRNCRERASSRGEEVSRDFRSWLLCACAVVDGSQSFADAQVFRRIGRHIIASLCRYVTVLSYYKHFSDVVLCVRSPFTPFAWAPARQEWCCCCSTGSACSPWGGASSEFPCCLLVARRTICSQSSRRRLVAEAGCSRSFRSRSLRWKDRPRPLGPLS